jgi:hypothetical protein
MSVQDIISNALIEYDAALPLINYLTKNAYLKGKRSEHDTVRSYFAFYDNKTDELIIETEYEILAVYYEKLNIWAWSWGHTGLSSAENYLSKEMLFYALKLEPNYSYIKAILTKSRGIINDLMQIDINIALGVGILKFPYIYPYYYYINDSYLIYYLILINKDGLSKLADELGLKDNYMTTQINKSDPSDPSDSSDSSDQTDQTDQMNSITTEDSPNSNLESENS